MRRFLLGLLVTPFLLIPLAGTAFGFPAGIDLINDFGRISELHIPALAREVTSHDPTGYNDDGFSGLHSFLYVNPEGRFVLFDQQGAGAIRRIWFTNLATSGRIMIYIDGSDTPVVNMPITYFFSGLIPPFKFPIDGSDTVSSGGFYSYVPIVFRNGCRIETSGPSHFYQITYETYASDEGLESYTREIDLSAASEGWTHCGTDPKSTEGVQYKSTAVSLAPGAPHVIFQLRGAGAIASVRIRPEAYTDEILRGTNIYMRFDDQEQPQVAAPLGDFFLTSMQEADPRALALGKDDDGYLYAFFPMPFWKSAQIWLSGDVGMFEAEIGYDPAPRDIHEGWFYAAGRQELTKKRIDHILLDAAGRGQYVGTQLDMLGAASRGYLEGDHRVYADGSNSPSLYGTGTEDYFNGGWYFNRGTFTLPAHGYVGHRAAADSDETSAYRLHFADPLPFMNGLRFGIEHDASDSVAGETYRSVAYWYGAPDPAMTLDAEINPGDRTSEALYQYSPTNAKATGPQTHTYEGDSDSVRVTDDGYIVKGQTTFTVWINPYNQGLVLRRLMNAMQGGQKATVLVDGEDVGVWETRGSNPFHRWREEQFIVPAKFTAGKDRVALTFVCGNAKAPWTEFRWWVFSILPPLPSRLASLAISTQDEPELGREMTIHAAGTYWDGTQEEVAGSVEWNVNFTGAYEMRYGHFTPLGCGAFEIAATAGAASSDPLTVEIPCTGDDEDDDMTDDMQDDAADDDSVVPGVSSDDHDGSVKCCGG